MNLVEALENESTKKLTENGAQSFNSSKSKVLDLFALGGSMRKRSVEDVTSLIIDALLENDALALLVLFYLRDVRGGQGERRIFRLGIQHFLLPKEVLKLIPEYGRWDDLLCLLDTPNKDRILEIIKETLLSDDPGLLPKWLPSINTSSKDAVKQAKMIARYMGWTDKKYRKILSAMRAKLNLLERKMSFNEWSTLELGKVPSQAFLKHMGAFERHIPAKYAQFIIDVEEGKEKVNTKTLYPYQIIEKRYEQGADALWNNLPDYTGNNSKAIVVADVSGSMSWTSNPKPLDVSISLALYFAERNKGPFKDVFITFSENPKFHRIQGDNLREKHYSAYNADWGGSTNINGVFALILNTALEYHVAQEDMPETVYIISDMEFDHCGKMTNFESIKQMYDKAEYKIPTLVFWNVNARNNTIPVQENEQGVVLVSGCSASTFSQVIAGGIDPYTYMLQVISSKRYAPVIQVLDSLS